MKTRRRFLDEKLDVRVDWFLGVLAVLIVDVLSTMDALPELRALLLLTAGGLFVRRLVRR